MREPLRRRVKDFVREVGELPACVGWYEAGHSECDGGTPCGWRAGCRAYRDFCVRRDVDPEIEKGMLGTTTMIRIVFDLLRKHTGTSEKTHRINRGLARFLEAFRDAMPGGAVLHPSEGLALTGELYVDVKGDPKRPRFFEVASIRVRGVHPSRLGRVDVSVVRYWRGPVSRLRPTIEFRAGLRELLDAFPEARHIAEGWKRQNPKGNRARAAAHRMHPERVEDAARLAVLALERGLIEGLRIGAGGRVEKANG